MSSKSLGTNNADKPHIVEPTSDAGESGELQTVDISGVNKEDLAYALWLWSCLGSGGGLTREQVVAECRRVGWDLGIVHNRVMKVNLRTNEVDPSDYDRYNPPGQFNLVLELVRKGKFDYEWAEKNGPHAMGKSVADALLHR